MSIECPFCGCRFKDDGKTIQLHIDDEHAEAVDSTSDDRSDMASDGSFRSSDDGEQLYGSMQQLEIKHHGHLYGKELSHTATGRGSSYTQGSPSLLPIDIGQEYMQCPEPNCGEIILLIELNEHLDYHVAEKLPVSSSITEECSQLDENASAFISTSANSIIRLHKSAKGKSKSTASRKHSSSLLQSRHRGALPNTPIPISVASEEIQSSPLDSRTGRANVKSLEWLPRFDTGDSSRQPSLRSQSGAVSEPSRLSGERGSRTNNYDRVGLRRRLQDLVLLRSPSISKGMDRREQPNVHLPEGRLGINELGPFAMEEKMPASLWARLQAGPRRSVETRRTRSGRQIKHERFDCHHQNIVPRLAELSDFDSSVQEAWYCHPNVTQITRDRGEGGLCGYRNIQMQASYIARSGAPGCAHFITRPVPTIPDLQQHIERGWDNGINDFSRVELGKLYGTRKWIGTTEVMTLYQQLGIAFEAKFYTDEAEDTGRLAHEVLLDEVEVYFRDGVLDDSDRFKVHRTYQPPIFLQRPSHSLTIVGFERHRSGSRNLVLFDCALDMSTLMHQYIQHKVRRPQRQFVADAMKLYRRNARQLEKYESFETLSLTDPPPPQRSWQKWERKE